jgi:hypothetical protein
MIPPNLTVKRMISALIIAKSRLDFQVLSLEK